MTVFWKKGNQLPQGTVEDRYQVLEKIRGKADVPRDHYPMLVTFADINDPKTVHEMKPDQVSSIFGAGYSLKSITLEITYEAVTEGRVEQLPFWPILLKQTTLSGLTAFDKSRPDPINYLNFKVFKVGE